jgi:hypothetical protein
MFGQFAFEPLEPFGADGVVEGVVVVDGVVAVIDPELVPLDDDPVAAWVMAAPPPAIAPATASVRMPFRIRVLIRRVSFRRGVDSQ